MKAWIAILAVLLLAACAPAAQTGRVVFTMTDAAANMGVVSKVEVTVDSVRVHSDAQGWVTVTSTPQTYDLLQLQAEGSHVLLADVQLTTGSYQQIRLDISKVVVTDADGSHEAKLPSGELKIVGGLEVEANKTSSVMFDFVADESLHVTGDGKYILAPVVRVETRVDTAAEVKADRRVEIRGGRTTLSIEVGMDAAGNVGEDIEIDDDAELSIEGRRINARAKAKAGIAVG